VLQAFAEASADGATVANVEALADAFLRRESVVALAPVVGEARFSTCELVAVERGALANAVHRAGAGVATADAAALYTAISARPSLSDEQRELVVALTRSGRGVEVVRSPAGAGKTFALDAARESWQASGVPVLGCALSARAACELRDQAAVEATTIARLTHALDLGVALAPGTVLLVDEAGVVGTRALARLADAVTAAEGKLVLVGDDRQLPEIEAGGLFAALADRLGALELREVRRQSESWDREALAALRDGDVDLFVLEYAEHGRIVTAATAEAVRGRLVHDWLGAFTAGEHAVMIANRRRDVAELNRRARECLQASGRLGPDQLVAGTRSFAIGDRVVARRNARTLGVVNGDAGHVTTIEEGRVAVELDGGRRVTLPTAYIEADHLDHGYALTAHLAQGSTVDRRPRLRARLGRAVSRVGLHRALPPPNRGSLLRQRNAGVPEPGAGAAPTRQRGRSHAHHQPLGASRNRRSASDRPARALLPLARAAATPQSRSRAGTVTQLSLDDLGAPRGLTRADLMTAREVAALLEVPISTVLEWGRNGTLPRVKFGRHVRFIRAHVEAAILDREQPRRP
jgi:excisionase family DNA binding protein